MSHLGWLVRGAVVGVFLSVILNGCSTVVLLDSRLSKMMYVDSQFTDTVQLFIIESTMRNKQVNTNELTMLFADRSKISAKEGQRVIGSCEVWDDKPVVLIDKSYWFEEDTTAFDKQALLFHELGHCLLGRNHCEVKSLGGESISLMEPLLVSSEEFSTQRLEMVNELFSPDPRCPSSDKSSNGVDNTIYKWEDLDE